MSRPRPPGLHGMTDDGDRMALLEPFVGEWRLETSLAPPDGVRARAVFEWALGGRFLVERSEVDVPEAPDGLCVVAAAPEGYLQHYFDSRGVVRLYAMTFDGRLWTLRREEADFSPLEFRAALHRRVRRRRWDDPRPLGDQTPRPGLADRLRPVLRAGRLRKDPLAPTTR